MLYRVKQSVFHTIFVCLVQIIWIGENWLFLQNPLWSQSWNIFVCWRLWWYCFSDRYTEQACIGLWGTSCSTEISGRVWYVSVIYRFFSYFVYVMTDMNAVVSDICVVIFFILYRCFCWERWCLCKGEPSSQPSNLCTNWTFESGLWWCP